MLLIYILPLLIFNAQAYKGKVFDYLPQFNDASAKITMQSNLQTLRTKMDINDNIVVLPEYGITSTKVLLSEDKLKEFALEIPEVNTNLMDSKINILASLAAYSRELEIYLLANIIEVREKSFFNTNIVLNPEGILIAKYRKINLDKEERKHLTAGDKIVTFYTTLGNFTTFTGKDILHVEPALTSLKNIDGVLYPSALKPASPFWSSLSLQDGYAKTTGVTLLASSYNDPKQGKGGSGIYQRNEPRVLGIGNDVTGISVLVAEVEFQKPGRSECVITDVINLAQDGSFGYDEYFFEMNRKEMTKIQSYNLPRGEKKFQYEMWSPKKQLHCKFNANIFNPIIEDDPYYRFVMYSDGDNHACGLVSCENENILSCGRPTNSTRNNKFSLVTIESFLDAPNYHIPSTLRYNMKPVKSYKYCSKQGSATVELKQQHSLVSFGIVYNDAASVNSMVITVAFSLIIMLTFF